MGRRFLPALTIGAAALGGIHTWLGFRIRDDVNSTTSHKARFAANDRIADTNGRANALYGVAVTAALSYWLWTALADDRDTPIVSDISLYETPSPPFEPDPEPDP